MNDHTMNNSDGAAHELTRHDIATNKLINKILDAEGEGEVLEVRDLVRAGEANLPDFRVRLDETREMLGELSLFPKGPDLTARILAKVEASPRPFVVEPRRRRVRRARMAVACGALAVLASVAMVQRLWPDAISLNTSPRPVTDLVAATRSDLTVTMDSIRGAFQRVGADISAPMAELTQMAGTGSGTSTGRSAMSRVASGDLASDLTPRVSQRRGRVAIALMPLPTDEVRLADPGVAESSPYDAVLAMDGTGAYHVEMGFAGIGTQPVGGNIDVARIISRGVRVASAPATPAASPTVLSGLTAPLAKAAPRPPLMLLSESASTCAFDRMSPLLITEGMVRGENPETTDWLRLDLEKEMSEGAKEGASPAASPAAPAVPK